MDEKSARVLEHGARLGADIDLRRHARLQLEVARLLKRLRRHVPIMTPAYEDDPARPKIVPKEQWYAEPARSSDTAPGSGP